MQRAAPLIMLQPQLPTSQREIVFSVGPLGRVAEALEVAGIHLRDELFRSGAKMC